MSPTEPLTALLPAAATKKLVEQITTDLYDLTKKELNIKLRRWKAKNHAEAVYKQLRRLRLVKTILQSEKEVDLTTFYHPSGILIDRNQRRIVHRLSDIDHDGSIVLLGTVGQGKSILLRYLAFAEFCASRRIPIFIELRRIKASQTVLSAALSELKFLGFEMDEEIFRFLAKQGRLVLLLDAFDEVKEDLRQDLLSEIEGLIREFDALRVVVTSRPHSGAEALPQLRVFEISPLAPNEYEQVIRKMAHDDRTAEEIIRGIRKEAAQIRHLLTTPLMVALLMVRYRIDQTLPQNSVSFYDSLFLLLLQRHDKMKAGYIRPRNSKLSDYALQEFFNAFCFVTRKARETSFVRRQLVPYAREALQLTQSDDDAEKVIKDIIDITCLVIADEEECRFIHKSVQEYHAALFIKNQPESFAIKFYKAVSKEARWKTWSEELTFLSEIDRYRYLKYFHIAQLESTLGEASSCTDSSLIPRDVIERIFGNDELRREPQDRLYVTTGSTGEFWPTSNAIGGSAYLKALFDAHRTLSGKHKCKSVRELLDDDKIGKKLQTSCSGICRQLADELRAAREYVDHVEKREAVLDLG